jgi:hypothetical protein
MLPSLWKKDFHRQITAWANEHGPVMKMRIMQFHVRKERRWWWVVFGVATHCLIQAQKEIKNDPEKKTKKKTFFFLRPSSSPTPPWPPTSAGPSCWTRCGSSTTSWTR